MPVPFRVPRFYPILDTALLEQRQISALDTTEALIEAGVTMLQYRHKADWAQANFNEARDIANICQESGVLFVLNDRADFARLLRVALHVGQDDLSPVAARKVIGDEIMGFSTHNRSQLLRANDEDVEYLSLGPIFETTSKQNPDPVVGLPGLRNLRGLTTKPLVAIGGVTLENAALVFEAKADAVAVISGVFPETTDKKALRRHAENWLRLAA